MEEMVKNPELTSGVTLDSSNNANKTVDNYVNFSYLDPTSSSLRNTLNPHLEEKQ